MLITLCTESNLLAGETRKAGFFAFKPCLCSNFFVLVFSVIMLPVFNLHYNDQFLHTAHITKLRRTTDGKILFCSSKIQKLQNYPREDQAGIDLRDHLVQPFMSKAGSRQGFNKSSLAEPQQSPVLECNIRSYIKAMLLLVAKVAAVYMGFLDLVIINGEN